MPLHLIDRLSDHARHRPEAIAVQQVDRPPSQPWAYTWRQVHERVESLSVRLREVLPPGAVVLLCCPNRPDFWLAYLACLAADLTVFPLSPDAAVPELQQAVSRSAPAATMAGDSFASLLIAALPHRIATVELEAGLSLWAARGSMPRQHRGAGMLLQSSGTTGDPRIVWRSGAAIDAAAAAMAEAIRFTPDDRVLSGMPLCHSYGVEHGLLAPVFAGSCVHLCRGIDLRVLRHELAHSRITLLPGVPFLFEILAKTGEDLGPLSSLRCAYSAGAPLPIAIYEAFLGRFGHPIAQLYGATEVGSVTFNPPQRAGFDPASVGYPMRDVQIRILDTQSPRLDQPLPMGVEGQVAICAASMLSYCLGDRPAPLLGGYVLTGDLGRLNDRGALTVTGRLTLLIDIAGRKVNPLEVEQVLMQHPAVNECVVVPVPVSQTVYRLKALVTCRNGTGECSPDELRRFARQHLSAYKVPRVVEFRASLPKTPLGKILRHKVEA